MSNVLILGGDRYLGWPTAMSLASSGLNVTVVDNYLRQTLAEETNPDALVEESARTSSPHSFPVL